MEKGSSCGFPKVIPREEDLTEKKNPVPLKSRERPEGGAVTKVLYSDEGQRVSSVQE